MDELQEAFAVFVPLVVMVFGVLSIRAWRRDKRLPQLLGGVFAVIYGAITIVNLAKFGNACGDFLFAEVGFAPRIAIVDVIGKGFLLFAAFAWALDAMRPSAARSA